MAAEPRGLQRRSYLDLLRGIAVLLMIDAHLFDSWTRFPDRETAAFGWAMLLGGMGTTLFLTLAGVAVALSAGSKLRRTGSPAAASAAVARRGLEIFLLAFVFRFQAWMLGWSHSSSDLLKVDVLNIMGPSIVLAAFLWRAGRTAAQRMWIFAVATAVVAFVTPSVRTLPPGSLPDALQAYITPVAGLSNFVFFPWLALVLAGAAIGVLLDAATNPVDEFRMNQRLAIGGVCALRRRRDRVVPATALVAFVVLDDVAVISFHASRDRCDGGGGLLCVEPGVRRGLEPAGTTRANVALHLLDSRRDGLRPHLAAAAPRAVGARGVRRLHRVLRLHAALFALEGRRRRTLQGPRVCRRRDGYCSAGADTLIDRRRMTS